MHALTYHDGSFHEGNPMIMGPLDQSFWLATMVFDGARAFDGVMPDLERHCRRCLDSALIMGLRPAESVDDMVGLATDMARRFPRSSQLYIRPTFWCGETPGLWPLPELTKFLMVLHEAPMEEPGPYRVCRSRLRRPAPDMAMTRAKAACHYPASVDALRRATERGFGNAVVLDHEGHVAELATANLFLAKDGVVHTPVPNGTFLDGVTRRRVIALLRRTGAEVVERSLTYEEVADADEIFSTGNYSKVLPVTGIEGRELQPGPFYRKARELYFAYARETPFTY